MMAAFKICTLGKRNAQFSLLGGVILLRLRTGKQIYGTFGSPKKVKALGMAVALIS